MQTNLLAYRFFYNFPHNTNLILFFVFLILLIFWSLLDKRKIYLNLKIKKVLKAINKSSTDFIFIGNFLYYFALAIIEFVEIDKKIGILILGSIIVLILVLIVVFSVDKYKDLNENNI